MFQIGQKHTSFYESFPTNEENICAGLIISHVSKPIDANAKQSCCLMEG